MICKFKTAARGDHILTWNVKTCPHIGEIVVIEPSNQIKTDFTQFIGSHLRVTDVVQRLYHIGKDAAQEADIYVEFAESKRRGKPPRMALGD